AALADRLGMDVERCATGVLEISAWNQANALRQVTVKRGLDVREFTLVSFGGSGSLLACRLADVLGRQWLVGQPGLGHLSASGLYRGDIRSDGGGTAVHRHSDLDVATVERVLTALHVEAD